MGRKVQSKTLTVRDMVFTVTPLSPTAALGCSVPLLKLIGAPAGALFGSVDLTEAKGGDRGAALTDALSAGLGGAVAALTERLNEAEVISLVQRLLEGCTVEMPTGDGKLSVLQLAGPRGVFDEVFRGDLFSMLKVVGLALEVNYLGPFGDWRRWLELAMSSIDKEKSKAESPEEK